MLTGSKRDAGFHSGRIPKAGKEELLPLGLGLSLACESGQALTNAQHFNTKTEKGCLSLTGICRLLPHHTITRNGVSKSLITSFFIDLCRPSQELGTEITQGRTRKRTGRILKQTLLSFQLNSVCFRKRRGKKIKLASV